MKSITEVLNNSIWMRSIPLAILFGLIALLPATALAAPMQQSGEITTQCYAVADEREIGEVLDAQDTLVRINWMTGATSAIGLTGTDNIEAVSFGPSRELYAANGGTLGILDLTTASFTPLASPFGTAGGSAGEVNLTEADSLAYDLSSGIFYGAHRRGGGPTDLLFAINPVTGAHIPDFFGLGNDYVEISVITDEEGNLLDDVDELSINPVSGELYASINDSGSYGVLALVDKTTGAATRIATFRYAPGEALAGEVIDDVEAIAFFNDGTMYASVGNNGPDENDKNRFYRIDPATALGVQLGSFPEGLVDYEALGCLTAEVFIRLEKDTNGPDQGPQDADDPTGPQIQIGDTVTWTYEFTNTGTVTLTDITLTDDQIGTIGPGGVSNCPPAGTILPPGESLTCTATGIAQAGQYANLATVEGQSQAGSLPETMFVTDTDPSHYFGSQPAITLEKYTNGQDADDPTGPQIQIGDTVTWTYEFTNTGTVTLTELTLIDDQIGTIGPGGVSNCPTAGTILPPGESLTCTATGIAQAGQYANLATVEGQSQAGLLPETVIVTDTDPSHYFGAEPAITLEKYTNGQDADDPNGADVPVIKSGDPVVWTYDVENIGTVDINSADIVVTDNVPGVNPVFDSVKAGDADDILESGEVWTYRAEGVALDLTTSNLPNLVADACNNAEGGVPGSTAYTNIGTVTIPGGSDTDPSSYCGPRPGVVEPPTGLDDDEFPERTLLFVPMTQAMEN